MNDEIEIFKEQEVLERIREAIRLRGSAKELAEVHGISAQYLSDIVKGRRRISPAVAQKFGFEMLVTFVRSRDVRGKREQEAGAVHWNPRYTRGEKATKEGE